VQQRRTILQELTKAQKGRIAIRAFKTIADSLILRGYFKPSGRSGKTLEKALQDISPEIYGAMNDPRSIELKGLEYVLERLPRGIEECSRVILTAQEDLDDTSFEKIEPPKRRRASYRLGDREICFVITRGASEMYDLLTHLTFLNMEAKKIYTQLVDKDGEITFMWRELKKAIENEDSLSGKDLDKAIWNLSVILGRTYQETKETYEYLEKSRKETNSNNGLFSIIYKLGKRVEEENKSPEEELLFLFTPAFRDLMGHHHVGRIWAQSIKKQLQDLELTDRPLHIISANMHSVKNTLYAYAATPSSKKTGQPKDGFYDFIMDIRSSEDDITKFSEKAGLFEISDCSGANIDFQIVDTTHLASLSLHPQVKLDKAYVEKEKPVILVMDYAFGDQAFEVMDELLVPYEQDGKEKNLNVKSVSIMGKAGILPGKKGDIMLATAHVIEGTANNYVVENDLIADDFSEDTDVFVGPILTVLGTSLQNRDVLEKFQTTSWKAVGLEMEGGHYQRAISAAIIKDHLSRDVKIRYAYYASDNPLHSGQTLASGSMGTEGIQPTYMITRVILEKILNECL
jgi:Family of unknown function (DUF6909)